jgi:hypothetical protein
MEYIVNTFLTLLKQPAEESKPIDMDRLDYIKIPGEQHTDVVEHRKRAFSILTNKDYAGIPDAIINAILEETF